MYQAIHETYNLEDLNSFVCPSDQIEHAIFTYEDWINQVVNISKKPNNYKNQIEKLQNIKTKFKI
jgi:hypothetical protein